MRKFKFTAQSMSSIHMSIKTIFFRLKKIPQTPNTNKKREQNKKDTEFIKNTVFVFRVAGFEPATTCTQNRYASKLRYTLAYSTGFEPVTFSLEG